MEKRELLKKIFLLLIFLAAVIIFPVSAYTTDEAKIIQAVALNKPCVVNIDTYDGSASGIGSGVILNESGYIITNAHVIKRANNIVVTLSNGEKYKAGVVKSSPEYDIAILKINPSSKLTVPRFGDSDNLKLGQTVIAIGNPVHFNWTVTLGVISALNREVQFMNIRYKNLIQTDAAINPGNSGGPLIDSGGRVIGINTLVYSGTSALTPAQGLSFAIPINDALAVATGLAQSGKKPSAAPWLGIKTLTLTPDVAERYNFKVKKGLLVIYTYDNSPASSAGLRPGDIITYVNNIFAENIETLKKILSSLPANSTIEITYWRQNKQAKTKLKIEMASQ